MSTIGRVPTGNESADRVRWENLISYLNSINYPYTSEIERVHRETGSVEGSVPEDLYIPWNVDGTIDGGGVGNRPGNVNHVGFQQYMTDNPGLTLTEATISQLLAPSEQNITGGTPIQGALTTLGLQDGQTFTMNGRQYAVSGGRVFSITGQQEFERQQQVEQQRAATQTSTAVPIPTAPVGQFASSTFQQGGVPTGARPMTLGNGQTVYVDTQGNFYDSSGGRLTNEQIASARPGSPPIGATQSGSSQSQQGLTQIQLGNGQTAYINSSGIVQSYSQPNASSPAHGLPEAANLPPEFQTALSKIEEVLTRLEQTGKVINPNVDISPERLQEFAAQAAREIDPYYANLLKTNVEGFLYTLGYSASQILENEKKLETKLGRDIRTLAEGAAEQGFALSGLRRRQEEELANETASNITSGRREFEFGASSAARKLAGEFGTSNVPQFTLSRQPTVSPGESAFGRPQGQSSLYNLSDSVYQGLTGTKQFEQEAARRSRTSELEEAERSKLALQQSRMLTI